jgi:hypothetical protein
MKSRFAVLAAALLALGACGSATSGPTVSTLTNDGFVSGTVTYAAGFVAGEAGAAVLGPQTKAFTIQDVMFMFGGADTVESITLTIYADPGTDTPGSVLYSHDYALTPSDAAMQDLDLTAQHIAVDAGQKIRVAVFLQHDGLPSFAKDGDGISAGRNYVYSSGWIKAETAGVTGDWIIRARIATN